MAPIPGYSQRPKTPYQRIATPGHDVNNPPMSDPEKAARHPFKLAVCPNPVAVILPRLLVALVAMTSILWPLRGIAEDPYVDPYVEFGAAVSKGEMEIVERMVNKRPDLVNARITLPSVMTPLQLAIVNGQAKAAGFLLEHGAAASSQDWKGNTPLHEAARLPVGAREFLTLLLDRGAKLEAVNNERSTPLQVALMRGTTEAVEFLLEKGANPNPPTGPMGMSPLHIAALMGRKEAAESLLRRKANVGAQDAMNGQLPLHWAALGGAARMRKELPPGTAQDYPATVLLLLDRGADVNATNRLGGTALHLAVASGAPAMARLLLNHHASPDARDIQGETPLFTAARLPLGSGGLPEDPSATNNWRALVELLFDHHADLSITNLHGRTVLQELMFNGFPVESELATAFVRRGATGILAPKDLVQSAARRADLVGLDRLLSEHPELVDTADESDGKSLVLRAVAQGQVKVAEILLRHHADVALGGNGLTLLHLAGSREIVDLLSRYKADLNARLADGTTPLHQAAKTRGTALEGLLEHGANPNLTDELGQTPLHYAARFSTVSSVEALLANGADANLRDKANKTPLDLALEVHRDDVVACFEKRGISGPAVSMEILGAAAQGDVAGVEAFIRKHPEAANTKLEGGVSLLLQAVTAGQIGVVELLLKNQADPRQLDEAGHQMFMTTNDVMIRMLLAAKADINAGNAEGETPLHKAVERGQIVGPRVVAALLRNGADPNRRDATGRTPLQEARFFVDYYTDLATRMPGSPVPQAPLQHLRDIITLLRKNGARD